jgi:spermidine/putrescine-binding protein
MSKTVDVNSSRRDFIGQAAAGVGALALSGLASRSAHAAATELRVLFPGGTWQKMFQESFTDPWTKANKTNFIWKTGLAFEPLIIAQRNRPQWDLIHLNQNTSAQLGAMDAVIEWKESDIPNMKHIHPSFKYPHLVGKVHTPYGLLVNTRQIKRPITKWSDLWDPALAGKVGFPSWDWMGQEVFHAINELNGGNPENVDPGIEKLKDLYAKNKAKTINNVEHTKQMVDSGEVWIAPHFGARTEQIAAGGTPVEFVIPEEGGLSFIWSTAIINKRPKDSIELAAKFVNFTLDAERQIDFCRRTGYPPTNMEAMKNLPPDLKKLALTDAQVEAMGKIQRKFDYMAMFAYRDQIRTRWNKEVLGS